MANRTGDHLMVKKDGPTPEQKWKRFGREISAALTRCGKTGSAVAKEIGVSTSTLSAWKLGQGEPDRPETTFALERAVGAKPGDLSIHLGYLPPTVAAISWRAALLSDPEVDDYTRNVILAVIQAVEAKD